MKATEVIRTMRALQRETAAKSLAGGTVLLAGFLVAAACGQDKPAEPTNIFANYGGSSYGPPLLMEPATPARPHRRSPRGSSCRALSQLGDRSARTRCGSLGRHERLDPVDNGIKSIAQQQAPGMKPEGAVIKTTLAPGAHGEGTVTLRPGKCYTIIGFGNLGVQQLAIRLVAPPPLPPQPLFEGITNGPTATIGAKEQCIRSPSPVATPFKVDIEMKQGQGQVGVQAYSK